MSAAAQAQRFTAQICWQDDPKLVTWVGGRTIHHYWTLLAPHFRDVLLPPHRPPEEASVAWHWTAAAEAQPISSTELKALRKRLTADADGFADYLVRGGYSVEHGSNALGGVVASSISQLIAKSDAELASFVCRTESGLRVHSWGAPAAAKPTLPDPLGNDATGPLANSGTTHAQRTTRRRRRAAWVRWSIATACASGAIFGAGYFFSRDKRAETAIAKRAEPPVQPGPKQETRAQRPVVAPLPFIPQPRPAAATPASGVVLSPLRHVIQHDVASAADHRERVTVEKSLAATFEEEVDIVFAAPGAPAGAAAGMASPSESAARGANPATSTRTRVGGGAGGAGVTTQVGQSGSNRSGSPASLEVAPDAVEAASKRMPRRPGRAGAPPTSVTKARKIAPANAPTTMSATQPDLHAESVEEGSVSAVALRIDPEKPIQTTESRPATAVAVATQAAQVHVDAGAESEPARRRAVVPAREAAAISAEDVGTTTGEAPSRVAPARPGWARVARLRVSPWEARLVGDAIVPTAPIRQGETQSYAVVREAMFAQKQRQLPSFFKEPVGMYGFAFEVRTDPRHGELRWQHDGRAESGVVATVDGSRAEIALPTSPSPSGSTSVLRTAEGTVMAEVSFGATKEPTVRLLDGVELSYWLAVDRGSERRRDFEWQSKSGAAFAASAQTHGGNRHRLQLPTRLSSGETATGIALVHLESGWALTVETSVRVEWLNPDATP